ncbi:tripartite tricarboxylate transporter TctB family protein, partial [Aeromonas taiwanensis]|uniref:tripartite tricarboxylate transporter TctB family protein n=1 Tax=Aeromonas taiwanensis TaxID=633417 RepID=UPI00248E6982
LLMASPGGERLQKESGNWRLVFAFLLLMIIYGVALTWLGFLVATTLFLIVGIRLMGEPSLAFACKVSVPFTLIFWALLTKGLNVYLEPGRLFTQLLG